MSIDVPSERESGRQDLENRPNILIVEDSQDDLELLLRALKRGGYEPHYQCVDNDQAFREALASQHWDVVLVDYQLPGFSGADAISTVVGELDLDVPVIVVSGAIGEETAVDLIKSGAQDYVLKDRMARLPVALERAIAAAETRREKLASEKQRALERENFISIVAHDLRAPVQRVETMVRLLRSDYEAALDDDGKDIIFRVERSTARLRLMLASLLAYSKCSRGAITGKVASLANTVNEILENIDIDSATTDVCVNLDHIDWVKADSVLIGHVLENLIRNAIKFRHKDRKAAIDINARHAGGGKVEISVADNGIGIEPRFATKVFEIFYRLHDDDEFEGTGIGLAICKKIVRDHDGEIWVDQGFSGGTRVVFTLMAVDEQRKSG